MSQTLSELLEDYEQLGELTVPDSPRSQHNARKKSDSAMLLAPPCSPIASSKPDSRSKQFSPSVVVAGAPQQIDVHGYCYPGAPEDINMFKYLWAIRGYHGKTEVWQDTSPKSHEIISKINMHSMMMETRKLGGYYLLDLNPTLWKELAFRLHLLEDKDQDDEEAKEVIGVVQRANKGWLRPFEQYCKDWPSVPLPVKDALIATLDHNIKHLKRIPVPITRNPPSSMALEHRWPPKSLDPITPGFEPHVVFRLLTYPGPGIPTDLSTCFYMMRLWRVSADPNRLQEAPLLPQPPPDASGKVHWVNYYNLTMEINNLGGPDEMIRVPASWKKLAFRLKLTERDDQDDIHSMQMIALLKRYFRDYLIYFGIFCDQWPGLASDKKKELVRLVLIACGAKKMSKEPQHPRQEPGSTPMAQAGSDSGGSESGTTALLPPPAQWMNHPPVDLIAYDIPGVPKDNLVLNYFIRMWTLEMGGRLGPLPAWKGVRPTISILHMHLLVSGYGGIDAMKRIPELWMEMVIQMKLAARWERGSDHMRFSIEVLKYVYRERLVPFERFCNQWPKLTRNEKAEHVTKLIKMLKDVRSDLPPPPSPDAPRTISANTLTVATSLEETLKRFHSSLPFEERIQRLQMLLPEQAAQHGIDEHTIRLCQQLSEENINAIVSVLTGAPSSSKPIQINTARTVGGSRGKAPEVVPANPPKVAASNLWSGVIMQAAKGCLHEIMKRINDSRALDLPHMEVSDSERADVKRAVHGAYWVALEFYHYAIFHILIYARVPWTEFIMRQACLILEQFFLSHAGSPVFIVNLQDAQFARRMLQDEVGKIKYSYALRCLERNSQVTNMASAQARAGLSTVVPSLSANA